MFLNQLLEGLLYEEIVQIIFETHLNQTLLTYWYDESFRPENIAAMTALNVFIKYCSAAWV